MNPVRKMTSTLAIMLVICSYAMAQQKLGNINSLNPIVPQITFKSQLLDTGALKTLNKVMKLQKATNDQQAFYSNMPVRILKKDDNMPIYQSRSDDRMPVKNFKLATKDSAINKLKHPALISTVDTSILLRRH